MEVVAIPSYDEMVTALAPALLRLAVMLTGTSADGEDLLQATLLKAHRHGERIAAMAAPAAYLRRVMVSVHLSNGRLLSRRPRTTSLAADVPGPDAADAVDARDEAWRLLATLPRQQRAVLVLRFYEDLPDAEIADLLGVGEGAVRSHASRGLANLRARLTVPEEP